MQSIKSDFSAGLNLDDSPYRVQPNAYIDALNVTKDAIQGSNDLVITNIVGNQLVGYTLPAGTNKVIGAYPHTLRDTIIYFVWNSNSYHLILEYDNSTRTISPILSNLTDTDSVDILGFTEHEKITSINVFPRETEGDMLYFLDSLDRPTGFNIQTVKAGDYNPIERNIIDVAKMPPLSPPSNIYGNDVNRRANNLRNKLFRFKYRYVYDDFEKSTFSPISAVPLPINILTDTYTSVITNNNVVRLSLNSGSKNVKAIELGMSFVEKSNDWNDFVLVESINTAFTVAATVYSELALTTTYAYDFRGLPKAGTVVTIKFKRLSDSAIVTAATYTTIAGDNANTVATALAVNAGVVGLSLATTDEGALYLLFDKALYEYSTTTLVEPSNVFVENVDFPYSFYNDGVYPNIDISESILLFDAVPEKANAQELANGNVLTYWGITEGYNRDLVPKVNIEVNTVAAGGGVSTGSLNGALVDLGVYVPGTNRYQITFTGIPSVGTSVKIKLRRLSDSVIVDASSVITVAGDTATTVTSKTFTSINAINIAEVSFVSNPTGVIRFYIFTATYEFVNLEITPDASSTSSNSIATFPFSTERRLGLVYFDQKGKTNGVLYNNKVTFPAYAENISQEVLLPYINSKIYHTPPDWAYSYQWVMTKENTNYLYWITGGVNKTESNYLYFDVSNLPLNQRKFPTTAEVLSYTFQDGDRVRLIRNDTTNVVFDDTYDAAVEGLVVDPKINGVATTGTFLKIKKIAPFNDGLFTSNFFVIQIYRPSQQLAGSGNQVYYEYGEEYRILNPTLSTRYHAGQVTDQDIATNLPAEFNFYNGDAYFRQRTVVISETGTALFNVLDRNFVDFYISAVNSIDGRPNIVDENARRAYYSTMVRFGQAYQPNTNINGLNRFFPLNFDEYDLSAGDIMRVKVRDRYIRVFQKFKVGSVPIFNQISKNADGTQLLVVTDKLLNPIQYYAGNKGIGEHAESLASYNFADYFTTNVVGEICRISNDGLAPISVLYKVNSWATEKLPLRTGNYKVYGAFDQRLNNYIVALEATGTDAAATLIFDEEANTFDSFVSLYPEMMTTLGTLMVSFKNGQLYTHDSSTYNNFFGVQYDSTITPVFNQGVAAVKSFMALEEKTSNVWDCPEIETSLMSYGSTPQQSNLVASDFRLLEGKWCSPLLRDSNSIGGVEGGDTLKGDWIKIKMRNINASNLVSLNLVGVRFIDSPLNNR
jgi:hypothetical protein